jgi:hypothetical protein
VTQDESQAARPTPECVVCPLCMGIAALRQTRPETVEHLLKAGAELFEAFRSLIGPPDSGEGGRPGGIQRIDIG